MDSPSRRDRSTSNIGQVAVASQLGLLEAEGALRGGALHGRSRTAPPTSRGGRRRAST